MKAFKTTILLIFLLLNLALEAQNTVKIGKQEWASKNLDVVIFRNGDTIPEAKTFEAWQQAANEGKPAWCYQANLPEYGEKFGKLYNWYAVNDSRGLAPKGYHIPTTTEWDSLISYLGGKEIAVKKLKSTEGLKREGNDTSEIGFSALPGGERFQNGDFHFLGSHASWWSATLEFNTNSVGFVELSYSKNIVESQLFTNHRGTGLSVRCIRD